MLYTVEWSKKISCGNGREYLQQYRKQLNGRTELEEYARSIGVDPVGLNENSLLAAIRQNLKTEL